ncbi:Hypothetical predicted protein [Mytilus galloprovincialis]|uniref:Uncharacterized protein n=1 Tax=Mytilus galloprovincialis TaxID=29158 RepID=A0A8B6D2T5_MYTGA|nr:Hypothetical predicted protein [Mytilus galloprovincialis]
MAQAQLTAVNFNIEKKEYWPPEGMRCEVEGCETPIYSSLSIYIMTHPSCSHIPVLDLPVKIRQKAREAARRQRERYAAEHKIEIPNLVGAITVPRDEVAYIFDVPGFGPR